MPNTQVNITRITLFYKEFSLYMTSDTPLCSRTEVNTFENKISIAEL